MNANTREQLITLGISLAVSAVFVGGLVLPRSSTLGAVRMENLKLQQSNQSLTQDNQSIAAEFKIVKQLKQEIDVARFRVPLDDHFAEYENNLLRLGEQYGLWSPATEPKIEDLTHNGKNAEEGVQTRSMRLEFTAEFGKFYNFLQALETQQKLTRIDFISVKPVNASGHAQQVTLELSIFYGSL